MLAVIPINTLSWALVNPLKAKDLYNILTSFTGILTTQRIDPIVSPGQVASHVHTGRR
jgi:hypothetical protein